jgi:glycosyltransferase involved in cell wall biosynthesis
MARICLMRLKPYPQDTRFIKEVDALAGAGHEVHIVCGRRDREPATERRGAVTVHRLPIAPRRGGPFVYVVQYGAFLVAAALTAARLHLRRPFDIVQVNSLPDALVFAAILPKLMGAHVVLQLLECMPEFVCLKYGLGMSHPLVRAVKAVERASIAFADRVITCNELMRARFIQRGAAAERVAVVMLSSDETIFDPERVRTNAPHEDGTFVLTYHGTLEESLGPDTAVRAIALLKDEMPGVRLRIFGDGTLRPVLEAMVARLRLEGHVTFSRGFVPLPELLAGLAAADAGVVPTKRNPMRELTHSTKMFDLIALRKPAIVARTAAVEAYFDASCLQLFESDDAADLARAIRELAADPERRAALVRRATEASEPYRWAHQRARYLALIDELVGAHETAVAA